MILAFTYLLKKMHKQQKYNFDNKWLSIIEFCTENAKHRPDLQLT